MARILSYFGYLQSEEWQYGWVYAIWYWIVMSHVSDTIINNDWRFNFWTLSAFNIVHEE